MGNHSTSEIVEELTELIGISETIILLKNFGGDYFLTPKTHQQCRLHKHLKHESIVAIADFYQGEVINYLPKLTKHIVSERNRIIHERNASGQSIRRIARDLDLSRRMVQLILRKPKPQAEPAITQLSLF